MYAGIYKLCMYVCMEWLTCDPCNSVGVFAHLYMAGKQAVEIACMPEDKGSKQGSTMNIGMYV